MTRLVAVTVAVTVALLALVVQPAFAHVGIHVDGFQSGALHPFTGLDHLLAMVAVGLWAAQSGGRAVWLLPAAFVVAMSAGGALALGGVALPGIEAIILISVAALGLAIAFAVRLPLALGMTVLGVFAMAHGHAHGLEAPQATSPMLYVIGFVAMTAVLHAGGVAAGLVARRGIGQILVRASGAGIALAGAALFAV